MLLPSLRCSFFDQSCNLLRPGDVDRVAGAETSTLWLLARVAYQRSRSGLMVLSLAATNIQLGLVLHAGVVMTALKSSAALSTSDRAMKAGRIPAWPYPPPS